MTDDRYDALVVGGGHNGPASAAYLARAGLRLANRLSSGLSGRMGRSGRLPGRSRRLPANRDR